jgi:hypothetical protein
MGIILESEYLFFYFPAKIFISLQNIYYLEKPNVSIYRWIKWEAFYFENFDDPLDHHYNLMIDSGADPEEVVSNPMSCEFFFTPNKKNLLSLNMKK